MGANGGPNGPGKGGNKGGTGGGSGGGNKGGITGCATVLTIGTITGLKYIGLFFSSSFCFKNAKAAEMLKELMWKLVRLALVV